MNTPKISRRLSTLLALTSLTVAVAFAFNSTAIGSSIGVDAFSSSFSADQISGKISARMDGTIVFSANEDNIISLSKPLLIKQVFANQTLEIQFLPNVQNDQYSVNGNKRALDQQGRAWLANVIPQLLRESTFDVAARVNRLNIKGGVELVISEIESIKSPYARSLYAQSLFKLAQLNDAQMVRMLSVVAAIGPGRDRERQEAYVTALKGRINTPQMTTLLSDLTTMKDSHATCEVLVAVAKAMPVDAGLLKQYRDIARTLTESERGRAEKALDHLNG
jgi:hypothetical protein